jgi:hypothetical protein
MRYTNIVVIVTVRLLSFRSNLPKHSELHSAPMHLLKEYLVVRVM